MEIIVTILSILLVVVGIVGTVLPMLPGLVLSISGLLIYKYLGNGTDLPMLYIWIFLFLTAFSLLLEYIVPLKVTKKYGGTKWGSIGGFIGMIVGFFFPIPLGFLVGMLAGVFIGEILHDVNDAKKALNSVKGAVIGFFYSTFFSFLVGVAILIVIFADLIAKLF